MLPSIMVVTLKFLISHEKSLQERLDYSEIINRKCMKTNFVYKFAFTQNEKNEGGVHSPVS